MHQDIYLVGLNHKTAPVEVREKFALSGIAPERFALLDREPGIREWMVLSTCNRVEFLVVGDPSREVLDTIVRCWAEICTQDPRELVDHIYAHQGLTAVDHLFTVAASLDSMIVGEPQILGQLKDAYRHSLERGTAKVIVNRLLHKSFSVAKRVRTETRISNSAVSVSYAAVELARHIFGDLTGKTVMLVGAGEMAELAATHLLAAGVENMLVVNRTLSRAQELAGRFKAEAVPFSGLFARLAEADIVISSTGATQTVVQARDVSKVMKQRKHRPMFFIDIAVPRDIDPDANSLDNVYLYDIDDLREVVEENLAQRQEEAARARLIVREEVQRFNVWLRSLELKPTIVDLLDRGGQIAESEVRKTLKNIGPEVPDHVTRAVETMAVSLVKKLYHEPISFLKRRSEEEEPSRRFISLTRRMFNLDRETVPEDAHQRRKNKEND
ncbi:MAG: glutamyl-tRNA reductase [Desulfohalobiaceae bacterium]